MSFAYHLQHLLPSQLTLNVESVEIILEDDATSKSPARPVVALNATAIFQVFEWTGQVNF